MKIKTASGITRFQEDKEYGTWFNKLFNVMKSTANCQPEQSIQPDFQNYGSSSDSEENGTNSNSSTNSGKHEKTNKWKLFVPIHETTKKSVKEKKRKSKQSPGINSKVSLNDPTRELLSLLKDDGERQQQRDEPFFTLMDRALHYYMMQRQSFQTPHHLSQQGRYPQNNQEIFYDTSNSRTFENL